MIYEAFPLHLFPANAATIAKAHRLLSTVPRYESYLTDYRKGCDVSCGQCPVCQAVKRLAARKLTDPTSRNWEVWALDDGGDMVDFAGILRLEDVQPGREATAHYFFFDGSLRDKTDLLQAWLSWAFEDHEDWSSLRRVSLELPAHAYATIRHATKRLGFKEEGRKAEALIWRGTWEDAVMLGRTNGDTR